VALLFNGPVPTSSRAGSVSHLVKKLQDQGQQIISDPGNARCVGMEKIVLKVGQSCRIPILSRFDGGKKPRVIESLVGCREISVDPLESLLVVCSVVSGGLMTNEECGQGSLLQGLQKHLQIRPRLLWKDSAQEIIAAKENNDTVDIGSQGPVEAGDTTGRGIAGDPGIADSDVETPALQALLELGDKTLLGIESEPLHETVSEDDKNPAVGLSRPRNDGESDGEGQALDPVFHLSLGPQHLLLSGLSMSDPLLAFTAVHLRLEGNAGPVNIINGISLDVRPGATLAITGPSGSGKSSLLMLMAGLETHTDGVIRLFGQDITGMPERHLNRLRRGRIGIVFQSFHLIPTMTALENVAIPLELAGREDAFARATDMLDAVGIASRSGHFPAQLSGGEQQRVAIARAMVHEPELILADEPTGHLDQMTGQSIMDLLFAMRETIGSTLVMVTHSRTLAERCDRVLRIMDGRLEIPPHD